MRQNANGGFVPPICCPAPVKKRRADPNAALQIPLGAHSPLLGHLCKVQIHPALSAKDRRGSLELSDAPGLFGHTGEIFEPAAVHRPANPGTEQAAPWLLRRGADTRARPRRVIRLLHFPVDIKRGGRDARGKRTPRPGRKDGRPKQSAAGFSGRGCARADGRRSLRNADCGSNHPEVKPAQRQLL